MRPYKEAKAQASRKPAVYRIVKAKELTEEQKRQQFNFVKQEVIDSYNIWNMILSYLPPNKKQQMCLLSKDINKRTREYIEWEIKDRKRKMIKDVAVVAVPEKKESGGDRAKVVKGQKELIDREFIFWNENSHLTYGVEFSHLQNGTPNMAAMTPYDNRTIKMKPETTQPNYQDQISEAIEREKTRNMSLTELGNIYNKEREHLKRLIFNHHIDMENMLKWRQPTNLSQHQGNVENHLDQTTRNFDMN